MGWSSRQAASDISWDKMAQKAERGLEIRSVFIHPVSTNYPCIYSVLLGTRIVLQNNSTNE